MRRLRNDEIRKELEIFLIGDKMKECISIIFGVFKCLNTRILCTGSKSRQIVYYYNI
jgi:hypothetical protein